MLKFIKNYIWLLTILSFIIAVTKDETRNFIWNNGYIIIPIILVIIIIGLISHIRSLKIKIPQSDIHSFQRIINGLNIHAIERVLHLNSSSLGFNQDISFMIETFFDSYRHVGNPLKNKTLKSLMKNFVTTLNNYYQKFSENACVENGIVRIYPEMKIDKPVKYDNLIKELDKLGNIAYDNLKKLLDFANQYQIMPITNS